MSPTFPGAHIAVFAREPRLGAVKTRLEPRLGAAGCLALYEAMLERTIATVAGAGLAPHSLWVSGDPAHPVFRTLGESGTIHRQQGDDLGARMDRASTTLFAGGRYRMLVIVGTDCPALEAAYLQQALASLAGGAEVVLGPAEDGGYVLIGLRAQQPALFAGIDWGSSKVLVQTEAAIETLGLRYTRLGALWDVDRPEDLARLDTLVPPLEYVTGE